MSFTNNPLFMADIPRHEELTLQPVAPAFLKVMLLERTAWWLLSCVALGIVVALTHRLQQVMVVSAMAALAVISLAGLWFTAFKAFANMGYALRRHDIVFRKGWLFEQLHIIPLQRVQHCRVKTGPLERRYGIASLRIFTAGSAGADITLDGLTHTDAQMLKDWLVLPVNNNTAFQNDTPAHGEPVA